MKNDNSTKKSNASKPMLCEVAVITPRFIDFLNFTKEQAHEKAQNERYFFVDSIKSVRGRLFDRVEKLHNYYEIKDIDNVLDYLETHLRSNRT